MANITVQQYQPSEIIAMFNNIFDQQNIKASGKPHYLPQMYKRLFKLLFR